MNGDAGSAIVGGVRHVRAERGRDRGFFEDQSIGRRSVFAGGRILGSMVQIHRQPWFRSPGTAGLPQKPCMPEREGLVVPTWVWWVDPGAVW